VTATTPQTAASSWKARAHGVHVVDIVSGKDVWSKPEGAVIATRANGIALFDRHGNSTL
jgi:hypothetical protein